VLRIWLIAVVLLMTAPLSSQSSLQVKTRFVPVAKGWAGNQINDVIFRRNAVTSFRDTQFIAFYDADAKVVLAKRKLPGSDWEIRKTQYSGDIKDAHKSISIAVDGDGFLHITWNHHNSSLQYCRGVAPGSLEIGPQMPMTGALEDRVTYPEFYNLSSGSLLFLYRDGASGNGNLVLNRYDIKARKWLRIQDRLIDGEGRRNAYWQMTVDGQDTLHLSWVWRETSDVATNHDMCYARSRDGGKSWERSSGGNYRLPITARSAEYVARIPQGSELINQTSMCVDSIGRPYIATYWRPNGTRVPQYHVIYFDGAKWLVSQVSHRTTPFSLGGIGTRRIPISRPQIVADWSGSRSGVVMIFRDSERGDRISVAVSNDISKGKWEVSDLTEASVGMWEPSYDPVRWNRERELDLFVERVGQGQAEGTEDVAPQMVGILEWVR
jgi:hypothetical protein